MTARTQGDVSTAVGEDTASGSTLDTVDVGAGAGEVGSLAARLRRDGVVDAGDGALGDIIPSLGTRGGGEGEGDESVLHFELGGM
jgi:hypothetical protein